MKIKNILPPSLKPGQAIAVIAPSSPVSGVCKGETIKRGYDYLRERGYKIIEGESVKRLSKKHTAGSVSMRVEEIHSFVKRTDVGCIMAFWGGYNCNQLLDKLDYKLIKQYPKIFIGFSDITALTTAVTTKTGLVTFSGPSVISFAKPTPFQYTWDYFCKTCINPKDFCPISDSLQYSDDAYYLRKDDNHRIKKHNKGMRIFKNGRAKGKIIVGNLQTLLLLNGTEYLGDFKNKILFLEEDESINIAYFDRCLVQCEQLGWFKKISGLVFGRFTEQTKITESILLSLFKERFNQIDFPILYNADFGHSDPMFTIPNGGEVKINTAAKVKIIFKKAVV
ncbi:MAG: LD-carboxypeptidase [Parcubacteria group bacterium]|nr:MAG: LD-carboxypeptidase [Parcubacteria group bacterium]